LSAQVSSIVEYWEWSEKVCEEQATICRQQADVILDVQDLLYHVLPLNHLHGIVVALLTTLWAGAAVELHAKLDGEQVCLCVSVKKLKLTRLH
jgi:malonyl-CoA/methylmalonyl-CoA synthetase